MLTLNHVKKNYPGFALDCSMELLPGRITGIVGPNGAGKSTTFKAILGLIRIDGGEITLDGKPIANMTEEDRQSIGVALSESGFSGYLTVSDIVKILRAMYKDFDETFFLRKCGELNLPLKKQVKDFSTGMKAKLKVLCAISHGADFLLLDEPTAGLDVLARDETLELLRDYVAADEKRSILISSHISSDLESICDDLYIINDGKVIFHEDTDRLLSDYAVLKADESQFAALDRRYILRSKREKFGYSLLTNQKRYYAENYPALVMEKGSIDDCFMLMIRGEELR